LCLYLPAHLSSIGLLDLVFMKNSGSLKMLDELVNMKQGDYSDENNIVYRQVAKVSLASIERDAMEQLMVSRSDITSDV
jgi:diacylglycerol kinase family enzyme